MEHFASESEKKVENCKALTGLEVQMNKSHPYIHII